VPIPRLIHPITIEIEPSQKTATAYDDDAAEPVRQVKRDTTITTKAQIQWYREDQAVARDGGRAETDDGYVLFLTRTLNALGYAPALGDRVKRIGTGAYARDVDLYFTYLEPCGHYPGQDGNTLLLCGFRDRQPTRSHS